MRSRSAPPNAVTPVLVYPDVAEAVDWLTRVFGFVEHVRIGDHRAQLGIGTAAMIVADTMDGRRRPPDSAREPTHSVMVRVDDVDEHFRRVQSAGAHIRTPPTDHAYGERQYETVDLAGHHWTFSQTIAEVEPEQWGGTTVVPW